MIGRVVCKRLRKAESLMRCTQSRMIFAPYGYFGGTAAISMRFSYYGASRVQEWFSEVYMGNPGW